MPNYQIIDAEQRSDAWFAARLGRLTGSRAHDMLAMTQKKEYTAERRNLKVQLVLERITGQPQEDPYTNGDMKRGQELEPDALLAYEAQTGELVATTGFLSHNELMAGCSLDGHIGSMTGIVDFKCPRAGVHLEYLRSATIPANYLRQLTHNLWMTGAEWAEMVSYCQHFPEHLQLCIRRIKASDVDLEAYDREVRKFLAECDIEFQALKTMANPAAQIAASVA
jgi:hypothetical protein